MNFPKISIVLDTDIIFDWNSSVDNLHSVCRLRIYRRNFDETIVIVSELTDNPGHLIRDELTTLLNLVCLQFNLTRNKIMWFEHYSYQEREIYEEVIMLHKYACRQLVSKRKLEMLLKTKL